ncbi:hypothetical protein BV25DRAFT_1922721, partial [Artomyces pyxidatus]
RLLTLRGCPIQIDVTDPDAEAADFRLASELQAIYDEVRLEYEVNLELAINDRVAAHASGDEPPPLEPSPSPSRPRYAVVPDEDDIDRWRMVRFCIITKCNGPISPFNAWIPQDGIFRLNELKTVMEHFGLTKNDILTVWSSSKKEFQSKWVTDLFYLPPDRQTLLAVALGAAPIDGISAEVRLANSDHPVDLTLPGSDVKPPRTAPPEHPLISSVMANKSSASGPCATEWSPFAPGASRASGRQQKPKVARSARHLNPFATMGSTAAQEPTIPPTMFTATTNVHSGPPSGPQSGPSRVAAPKPGLLVNTFKAQKRGALAHAPSRVASSAGPSTQARRPAQFPLPPPTFVFGVDGSGNETVTEHYDLTDGWPF